MWHPVELPSSSSCVANNFKRSCWRYGGFRLVRKEGRDVPKLLRLFTSKFYFYVRNSTWNADTGDHGGGDNTHEHGSPRFDEIKQTVCSSHPPLAGMRRKGTCDTADRHQRNNELHSRGGALLLSDAPLRGEIWAHRLPPVHRTTARRCSADVPSGSAHPGPDRLGAPENDCASLSIRTVRSRLVFLLFHSIMSMWHAEASVNGNLKGPPMWWLHARALRTGGARPRERRCCVSSAGCNTLLSGLFPERWCARGGGLKGHL